jgi:soluble lytic murein transglycosylase-like protein
MRPVVFSVLALGLVSTDAHAENSAASLNKHPIGGQRTWQSTLPRTAQDIDAPAIEPGSTEANRPTADSANSSEQICHAIELAARENKLPVEFLAHLIWQESRFNPGAVSRAGAQGVAQFMPTTAAWRGLENPFDPISAIRKSAELLSALVMQFGNLALAAAAYNAGSKRVQDWIEGRANLPRETQRIFES